MHITIFKRALFFLLSVMLVSAVPIYCCEDGMIDDPEIVDDTLTRKLFEAILDGSVLDCKQLLEAGADPKQPLKDSLFVTELLPFAASKGFYTICKLLITYGANVDARGLGGYTALHFAAKSGDYKFCKYLLQKGAQINLVTDDEKLTPLFLALCKGHLDICKLFIACGADVNQKVIFYGSEREPLKYAAQKEYFAVCKMLISKGAFLEPDFAYGNQDINDYVQMVAHLKLVYEKKWTLKKFAKKYLNESCQKKNVLDITYQAFSLWDINSDFFKSLWASYTDNLKNYFFLASDFELVKKGTLSVSDYSARHLEKEKKFENTQVVADLLKRNGDRQLFNSFIEVIAKKAFTVKIMMPAVNKNTGDN